MLRFATGSDGTRTATDVSAYRYLLGTARDAVGSLLWSPIASDRPRELLHETHYAFGAIFLVLVPYRRAPSIAGALVFALVLPLLYALDVAPISTALLKLPLMGAFRVPMRSLIPFAIMLPIVALANVHGGRGKLPLFLAPLLGSVVIAAMVGMPFLLFAGFFIDANQAHLDPFAALLLWFEFSVVTLLTVAQASAALAIAVVRLLPDPQNS